MNASSAVSDKRTDMIAFAVLALVLAIAPAVVYPVFMMKVMCFALFACAFNLLLGFGGLLSFGHAMFIGSASYVCAHAAKVWGFSHAARRCSASSESGTTKAGTAYASGRSTISAAAPAAMACGMN